jgi:hypothetical protein
MNSNDTWTLTLQYHNLNSGEIREWTVSGEGEYAMQNAIAQYSAQVGMTVLGVRRGA